MRITKSGIPSRIKEAKFTASQKERCRLLFKEFTPAAIAEKENIPVKWIIKWSKLPEWAIYKDLPKIGLKASIDRRKKEHHDKNIRYNKDAEPRQPAAKRKYGFIKNAAKNALKKPPEKINGVLARNYHEKVELKVEKTRQEILSELGEETALLAAKGTNDYVRKGFSSGGIEPAETIHDIIKAVDISQKVTGRDKPQVAVAVSVGNIWKSTANVEEESIIVDI